MTLFYLMASSKWHRICDALQKFAILILFVFCVAYVYLIHGNNFSEYLASSCFYESFKISWETLCFIMSLYCAQPVAL